MPQTKEFLPFHAINEFMRPDFRLAVIRETLNNQSKLPDSLSVQLNQLIKQYISVPGFRNSEKAPPLVKVLPSSKAFEKHPDLVAIVLASWAELYSELRDQTYELLKVRNWTILTGDENIDITNFSIDLQEKWPVLPLYFDRTKLPGFYTYWPKGENFDVLYDNFSGLFADSNASIDKVSLMVVWLSMRLPYHVEDNVTASEESNSDLSQ